MDNRQFIEDYKEAFSEKAALPIAFWHSDTPVSVPEPVNGCFFPAFEKVREGQPVSFDSTTMKCGGGKFYCGLAPMPEYVPTFVSEKEHYKASPALVKDFVERLEIDVDKHKYLNFQRLDLMDDSIEFYGVLIFATPDILSGLVSWAYYDNRRSSERRGKDSLGLSRVASEEGEANSSADAVYAPWGSGCSTTIRQVIIEEECLGSRCFIGLFDPSVRPRVRANELMFGIPKSRLEEMATFMRDTCLFNGAAWPKVKERIKDGSTKY